MVPLGHPTQGLLLGSVLLPPPVNSFSSTCPQHGEGSCSQGLTKQALVCPVIQSSLLSYSSLLEAELGNQERGE